MTMSDNSPEKPEEKFCEGDVVKLSSNVGLTDAEKSALTRRVLFKLDVRLASFIIYLSS